MKSLLSSLALVCFSTIALASQSQPAEVSVHHLEESQVDFKGSRPALVMAALPEAAQQAEIYVVKTGAEWCGPCEAMKGAHFLEKFGKSFSGKVSFFELNVSPGWTKASAEEAEYTVFGRKFTGALPTLFFFDRDGKQIVDSQGYSLTFGGFRGEESEFKNQQDRLLSILESIKKGEARSSSTKITFPLQSDVLSSNLSKDGSGQFIWRDFPAPVSVLIASLEGSTGRADLWTNSVVSKLVERYSSQKVAFKEMKASTKEEVDFFEGLLPQAIVFIQGKQIAINEEQQKELKIWSNPFIWASFSNQDTGFSTISSMIDLALKQVSTPVK